MTTPATTSNSFRRLWISIVLVLLSAFVLLNISLATLAASILRPMLLGWFSFLTSRAGVVRFDFFWSQAAGLCLIVLLLASMRVWRLAQPTASRWRCGQLGLASTLLALSILTASVALIAATHQVTGMAFSEERVFNRYWPEYSNAKKLGAGLKAHSLEHQELPIDQGGHSWTTALLPYLGQQDLASKIHPELPWYAEQNEAAFRVRLPFLINQSLARVLPDTNFDTQPGTGYALTNFSGNIHVLGAPRPLRYADINDGLSTTILAGEIRDNFPPWGQPGNVRDPQLGINTSPDSFGGGNRHSIQFVMTDGSVQHVSSRVSPEILKAYATPSAGDRAEGW